MRYDQFDFLLLILFSISYLDALLKLKEDQVPANRRAGIEIYRGFLFIYLFIWFVLLPSSRLYPEKKKKSRDVYT